MRDPVIQQGELGELTFVDLVAVAARAPMASILRLVRAEQQRSFYFHEGRLVAVAATSPNESLTAMLIRRKKLQSAIAQLVEQVARKDGMSEAQVIMRDRILPMPQLVQEMNLWATLLLVQSFGWQDGRYEIRAETAEDAAPDALLEIELPAALLKGIEKRMDPDIVRGILGAWGDKLLRPVDTKPFALSSFELDSAQRQFWATIDGTRSGSQLLSMSTLPGERGEHLLFLLLRLGMVEEAPELQQAEDLDWGGDDDLLDDLLGPSSDVAADLDGPGFVTAQPGDDLGSELEGPAAASDGGSGIDWSQISFRRREGATSRVAGGQAERLDRLGDGPVEVAVARAHIEDETPEPPQGEPEGPDTSLDGIFDGLGLEPPRSGAPRGGKIAPPRGGRSTGGWSSRLADEPASAPAPSVPPPAPVQPEGGDSPPRGAGPEITNEEWARLSTKERERVRVLRRDLNKMERSHYYEWFGVPVDSPVGSIKKAYFQMARMYHPDSLLDESDVYTRLAEALFSKYSEAYDVLSDAERRDKYTRKAVHGEKDEDELAMERVQMILAAEDSFKRGLRALNQGRLADALKRFADAVEKYDEEAEYVAYYGYALHRARGRDPGEADRALELVRKATELKPQAAKPWHLMGKVWLLRGDAERAKKALRKALKIRPDDAEALRDYKAADSMAKAAASDKDKADTGLLGLFGRLGKKKEDKSAQDDGLDFDFDF